jgi:hypothetical protein
MSCSTATSDTQPDDAGQGWAILVAEQLIVGLALANNLPPCSVAANQL